MRGRLAITALVLLLLAGIWLVIAPFAVGYQPRGAAWVGATRNDVVVGCALTTVSFLTLAGYAAAVLREVTRREPRAPGGEER